MNSPQIKALAQEYVDHAWPHGVAPEQARDVRLAFYAGMANGINHTVGLAAEGPDDEPPDVVVARIERLRRAVIAMARIENGVPFGVVEPPANQEGQNGAPTE